MQKLGADVWLRSWTCGVAGEEVCDWAAGSQVEESDEYKGKDLHRLFDLIVDYIGRIFQAEEKSLADVESKIR